MIFNKYLSNSSRFVFIGISKHHFSGGQLSVSKFYKHANVCYLNAGNGVNGINYYTRYKLLIALFDTLVLFLYRKKPLVIIHLSGYLRLKRVPHSLWRNRDITHFLFENERLLEFSGLKVSPAMDRLWKTFRADKFTAKWNRIYNSELVRDFHDESGQVWFPYLPDGVEITYVKRVKTILIVGRLIESKGIMDLPALLTGNPEVDFVVVGTGPLKELLMSFKASHGNLRLEIGLSNDELRILYQEADIYLSLSKMEGFCMPFWEAVNAGTIPVIIKYPYSSLLFSNYSLCLSLEEITEVLANGIGIEQFLTAVTWLQQRRENMVANNRSILS